MSFPPGGVAENLSSNCTVVHKPQDGGGATLNSYYDLVGGVWTRREQFDIRHPDGTVVLYATVGTGSDAKVCAVRITDPMDNTVTLDYDAQGRVARIAYPNGIEEDWNYNPQWGFLLGQTSAPYYSGIEVTYGLPANAQVQASDLTWGMVFKSETSASQSVQFSQARLWRVFYPRTEALDELSPSTILSSLHTLTLNGGYTNSHAVVELEYDTQSGSDSRVTEVRNGRASGFTNAVLAQSVTVMRIAYGSPGPDGVVRVASQWEMPTSPTNNGDRARHFTYSFSGTPAALVGVEELDPRNMKRVLGGLDAKGRPATIKVQPTAGFAVDQLPRKTSIATGEDATLHQGTGYATAEPDDVTTTYEYNSGCSACALPTKITDSMGRIYEATYDPLSKRPLTRKVPNPSNPSGAGVTTTYTWVKGTTTGYSAEYPGTVTNPDGTWTWTYTWVDRFTPTGLGGLPIAPYGKKPSHITATGPSGVSPVVTMTTVNDVTNPNIVFSGGMNRQLVMVGQVLSTTDGVGVTTSFDYDANGMLSKSIVNPSGAAADRVITEYTQDAWGRLIGVVVNQSSALQQSYAYSSQLSGHPLMVTATVGGVTNNARIFRDRWGHVGVALRSNKTSTGGAPNDFGNPPRSDAAREWLRDEFHWEGDRLRVMFEDRRSLDRSDVGTLSDALDARYLRTDFTYTSRGEVLQMTLPNGAERDFTWDGYGTLYMVKETDGGSQSVLLSKSYVNAALEEISRFRGDTVMELWTLFSRNAAGAITKVVGPIGVSPGPFYTGSLGGAEHSFTLDSMGRATEVLTRASGTTTVLARKQTWFDQLGRAYKADDHSLLSTGVSTGILQTRAFWQGLTQTSRIEEISNPGGSQTVRATENSYDALGRLVEVRTQGTTPDKTRYVYKANTNFVEQVFRDMFDAAPTTGSPGIVTYRTDYVYDALGRVLQVKDYGTGSSNPLVNSFTYYSTGATESHIDPSGKVQWYLPDARSRLVEHFLPGTQPIWNGSEYRDWTNSSGRTELLRTDGRGRLTKTAFDFAGRPFVVMDPGAATEPTAAAKHQAFSRYMEYDSASRVSRIYSGEAAAGKSIQAGLFYDGPGRLIARMSDSPAVNTDVSFMSTWDVYTRDALGRVAQSKSSIAPLSGPIDLTIVDRVEDSLGRVHSESFWNHPIDASPVPGVRVDIKHTWTGADPFRSGLEYSYGTSNPANLAMGYTPDILGRTSTVSWNPTGSSATLATYAYQGSATSKKTIAYSSTVNGVTDFAFDQYGRHSKIETLNGSTVLGKVEFFYDAASNLTKEKYAHFAASGVVREGDRFFYDEHHRLADAWLGADTATFNTEPPPATPTLVKRVTYGLDAANNRTQVATADASGNSTETYATDDDSTPSNRYTTVGPQAYLYDARGNLTFDGRFIYVYDYLNRLSEVWTFLTDSESEQMMASSSTSTGQRSVLRPESRRRFVVNNRDALFGARRAALARVERGAVAILRMASDPVTARQLSGSIPSGTLSLQSEGSAPSSSQALTDASTIPTRLAPIAFYGYDGFERRTFRLVALPGLNDIFFYAYDGWQEVSEQVTLDGNTPTPTVQSVWGRELDELLAIRVNSTSGFTTSYVAEGGAHCPQWLVNSAGTTIEQQQYDAYGATSHWVPGSPPALEDASPQQSPWGWKGHRIDRETGFVQMRHRYYSVVLGRFLTSDPLGVWGDARSSGNSYAYGACTPLVASDALGLQVGHHIVPVSIFDPNPNMIGPVEFRFSDAARRIFDKATTGAPEGGLPLDKHKWDDDHKVYNEAVREELRRLREAGEDFEQWDDKKAGDFVERVRSSPDHRIARYLGRIEDWLNEISCDGVKVLNRGITALPGRGFFRGTLRLLGELGKPIKLLALPIAVFGFSSDAEAYGYGVATLNAVNPIPFVDVQDVVDIEPLQAPAPLLPPGSVYSPGFVGPLPIGSVHGG
jgi:RHS repeat-associated protein